MSPIVTVGIDFAAAQKEAEAQIAPAPTGVYTLQCADVKVGEKAKSGRPMILWLFKIVNSPNPDLNGKTVRHRTIDPSDGDTSGIGFLTDVTAGLGKPWKGTSFNTDDYRGATCKVNLGISEDGKWNNIDSFIK